MRIVAFKSREEADLAACVLRTTNPCNYDVRPVERASEDLLRELGVRALGIDECVVDDAQEGRDKPLLHVVDTRNVRSPVSGARACEQAKLRLERDWTLPYDADDLV